MDIGIGNARIAKHLCGIPEMWGMIESYDGTDNAQICVNLSRHVIKELKTEDKVTVYFLDAVNLNRLEKHYDLIIITCLHLEIFILKIFLLTIMNFSKTK